MDNNENIIYKKQINLQPWIEKYGNPGLSTNVFEVDGIKYLLFHSYVWFSRLHFKYFIGLLRLNDDLSPLGYVYKPLFEAKPIEGSDEIQLYVVPFPTKSTCTE